MTQPSSAGLRLGTAQARWVLATTVLGSGLAMLDATVVNVALKRIGADLGADFAGLQWTVNAYTLVLASFILLGGSLGDRFGRRRVFVIGVVWFATASLLCGLAPNVELLIAARALQGVGGALLTPGSLAIISASFHGSDRDAAIGAWSGLGGIAGAVGPFVGGVLVEWSWRAVFLVNLPIAIVVVAVAARHVPESRNPDAAPRLDVAGTVLAVLGLGAVTYALTAAGERVTPLVLGVGAVGVAALWAFVVVERRSDHPLVPMSLFGNRQFSAVNLVTLLIYAAFGVLSVLLVLNLQIVAGFTPLLAGTALLPVTLVMLLFSARAGALAGRIGPRVPITVGPLVAAVGMLLMSRVGAGADYWRDVVPAALVFGAGLTLIVAPLTATVLDSAPDADAGVASGVNNAVARAANLLAVAVIPTAAGITGAAYTDPATFTAGYRTSLWISTGLLVAAGVLAAVFVRRSRPREAPPAAPGGPDDRPRRVPVERYRHSAVAGPALHPHPTARSPAQSGHDIPRPTP